MNYTLITGASRGIGKALARSFAREGNNLILLARSADELDALAIELEQRHRIRVQVLVMDLLAPDAAYDIYRICQKNEWPVRILVNNAGMGLWGRFDRLSLEHQQEMVQLNLQLSMALCHHFLPQMKEIPYAHILNVAGTAAFQPVPYFNIFSASKSFVTSFSLALRDELKAERINVSCLCPGPTNTSFYDRAGFEDIRKNQSALMKAEEVADAAVRGLMANKPLIVPGFSNQLGRWMSRLLPRRWMSGLLGNYFKPD